jgi:DNA-binding XRE family transcriptional regulator
MFPNLMGQKAYRKLTSDEMGAIIGLSRQSYESKMATGRFTPAECKAFCKFFGKPFDFLFATDDEVVYLPTDKADQEVGD